MLDMPETLLDVMDLIRKPLAGLLLNTFPVNFLKLICTDK